MKKLLLLFALAGTITVASGQKSIDALFAKYAGQDGFTTVTINGNLLKLMNCFDEDDDDNSLPVTVTEIRILAQDDDKIDVENFYDQAMKGLNLGQYEEFMRVKESDQDIRMLVRAEGRKFTEFLLIAGGEDNALIQIKGEMTFAEAKKFSNDAKKNNGLKIVADHN